MKILDINIPRTKQNDISTSVESNIVPNRKTCKFKAVNSRKPFVLTRHAKMQKNANSDCICCGKENILMNSSSSLKKPTPIRRRKLIENRTVFFTRNRKIMLKCYKCVNCGKKIIFNDTMAMCIECIEDFSSQNLEIAILNEEDAYEYVEMKKRIGNSFQAEIPEQSFHQPNIRNSKSSNLKSKIVLNNNPWKTFKKNIQKLFPSLKFSDEKLLYLLSLFQYEMEKCLAHMNKHRKEWLTLLKTYDFI